MAELESRITGRGTDAQDVIRQRMETAREELELMQHYDYVVVNDEVQRAVDKINAIILSEHLKVERVVDQIRHDMQHYYEKGE